MASARTDDAPDEERRRNLAHLVSRTDGEANRRQHEQAARDPRRDRDGSRALRQCGASSTASAGIIGRMYVGSLECEIEKKNSTNAHQLHSIARAIPTSSVGRLPVEAGLAPSRAARARAARQTAATG